jgi:Uma2 family endonuclease
VWLVDLEESRVETFAQAAPEGYRRSHLAVRGERVTCAAIPDFSLSVDEMIP